jgi:chromosome segregation ATPase
MLEKCDLGQKTIAPGSRAAPNAKAVYSQYTITVDVFTVAEKLNNAIAKCVSSTYNMSSLQDAAAARAAGDEPLIRSAPAWLKLHFHVLENGNLAQRTSSPGSRATPYARDGARAVAALLAALRRQRSAVSYARRAAKAAQQAHRQAESARAALARSVAKAYRQMDKLEADIWDLQVLLPAAWGKPKQKGGGVLFLEDMRVACVS